MPEPLPKKPIHYLKQKKKYIYIRIECCSFETWKQLCAVRTSKRSLMEQEGILYPCLLLSQHDKADSCGDSEVILKPVDHCNGMEIIPQTAPLVDRLVYFPDFIIIIIIVYFNGISSELSYVFQTRLFFPI